MLKTSIVFAALLSSLGNCSRACAGPLVSERIDESRRVALRIDTNVDVSTSVDLGETAPTQALQHLWLRLKRSPQRETALAQFIADDLYAPQSPNFHHWLTPQQLGTDYGPDPADIDAVTRWLRAHGLSVNSVYPNGMLIDFSGTAQQVETAFQTSIHQHALAGKVYLAPATGASVPAALDPVVGGIVSLSTRHSARNLPKPSITLSPGTFHGVTPADFATIYNIGPVWDAGIRGAGQTVAVIALQNVVPEHWNSFRKAFGLSGYRGTLTQVHPAPPSGANNCTVPSGSDPETALDAEWASVAAPDATILVASCNADDGFVSGYEIALNNLLNGGTLPASVSLSGGGAEKDIGDANQSWYLASQQAATEGVAIYSASGDSGSEIADASPNSGMYNSRGFSVGGYASSPYVTAVGGTDFLDTFQNTTGQYWNASNAANFGSAVSYVPEMTWNDSCASPQFAQYAAALHGVSPSDPLSFCNSATALDTPSDSSDSSEVLINVTAGGGGPSTCGIRNSSGACAGWPKPSWQKGVFGVPDDGVRDIPDVSLFAGDGVWGHGYAYCYTVPADDPNYVYFHFTCDPSSTDTFGFAGGTSFSAPAFAGIQALINQKTGARAGNLNPALYALGAKAYGSSTAPNNDSLQHCDASLGSASRSDCIFHDITRGTIAVPCAQNTPNCYVSPNVASSNCGGKTCGILSTSASTLAPGYDAAPGWDFASGLGSVNVANLLASFVPTTANSLPIGGYTSGNWYDPALAGQGFQLEFTGQGNTALAIWFTFAPDGSGQNWIYAQGTYDPTSGTVTLPAILLQGGRFPSSSASGNITQTSWGTLTFSFSDCNTGSVTWNSTIAGYGNGTLPLSRLTSIGGTACPTP